MIHDPVEVLELVRQHKVLFLKNWFFLPGINYTIPADHRVSSKLIRHLVGAGLVQRTELRGEGSWVYRLTDLGEKAAGGKSEP